MSDPNPTLFEILQLSYPHNAAWLSAVPDSDMKINWVCSHQDDLQPGDILVIERGDLTAEILDQIQDSGGVAVIIVGEARIDQELIPEGLAVISLPKETSRRKVQQMLLDVFVNQQAHLLARSIRIHERLTTLTAEGEGLSSLVRVMSELCGGGVVVQDKRLNILASYSATHLLSIWESVLKQVSDEKNLPEILRDRKAVGRKKVNLRQSMHESLERVVAPIIAGGVARGYLSIIELSDRLDAVDELVADQGAVVCAIEMSRAKAVREAEKRLKGNLLTALLQENIAPRDAVLWIQGMGLDLDRSHAAIRFAWDGSETPSMRRLETIINGEIARGSNKVLVEKLGSEVVCICQVAELSGRPLSALSLANAVAETAHQEFPDVPLRCGIGSPASELAYWRDSFRQAGQALDMARRLADRSPKYFPDLSVYRLLLQLERYPDLLMFKNEILAPLIAYEGGGELIRTLEVYFEHNGVLSQAAEALFIHRNTLIYRMERIEEITGLDLNDTETRLAVQLALRIHRMKPVDHHGCD